MCVCMCIPPIFAKPRLGKNVTPATNTRATKKNYWTRRFCAVRISKESRRLVLPRTYCFHLCFTFLLCYLYYSRLRLARELLSSDRASSLNPIADSFNVATMARKHSMLNLREFNRYNTHSALASVLTYYGRVSLMF
jgi:hypothetical protein